MSFFHGDRSLIPDWLSCLITCISILLTTALLIVLCLICKQTLIDKGALFNVVSGSSMAPQLQDGQLLYAHKRENFIREDIVTLELPRKGEEFPGMEKGDLLVKRIIGLPGEHVKIDTDGRIYIDDAYFWEPYLTEDARQQSYQGMDRIMDIRLQPGEYFVMGDNRGDSLDSRAFGPVAQTEILAALSQSPTGLILTTALPMLLLTIALPLLFYKGLEAVLSGTACRILSRKQA